MTTAITVVGDALLDVYVVPARPPRPGGDVPAEIRIEPGGQGANVAVRLGRRRLPVRLVCALGADAAGASSASGSPRTAWRSSGFPRRQPGQWWSFSMRCASARCSASACHSPVCSVVGFMAEAGWLVVSGYLLLEPDAGISGAGESPRRVLLGCSLDSTQVPAGWMPRPTCGRTL